MDCHRPRRREIDSDLLQGSPGQLRVLAEALRNGGDGHHRGQDLHLPIHLHLSIHQVAAFVAGLGLSGLAFATSLHANPKEAKHLVLNLAVLTLWKGCADIMFGKELMEDDGIDYETECNMLE